MRKVQYNRLPFGVDDFNRIVALQSNDLGLQFNDEVMRIEDFDLHGKGCKLFDVVIDNVNQKAVDKVAKGKPCRKIIPY